jgi:hypothetical protein
MSRVPTLEDVRKALSAVKGSTFHIDGGLVYIYHTIIHDENHPIDLRYSNTNLYIKIKQICDRMKKNLMLLIGQQLSLHKRNKVL